MMRCMGWVNGPLQTEINTKATMQTARKKDKECTSGDQEKDTKDNLKTTVTERIANPNAMKALF